MILGHAVPLGNAFFALLGLPDLHAAFVARYLLALVRTGRKSCRRLPPAAWAADQYQPVRLTPGRGPFAGRRTSTPSRCARGWPAVSCTLQPAQTRRVPLDAKHCGTS
jgi:hypothetical protein